MAATPIAAAGSHFPLFRQLLQCRTTARRVWLPLLQIVEVINERKLAITLSGFINQIFDKASPCHAAPGW